MKTTWLCILILVGVSAHISYAETQKQKSIKLLDAFREMAAKVKTVFAPKAKPVKTIELSKDYNIHNHSIIASGRLDQFLGGVLAGKGEKFLAEARKNDICPIFLAAIAIHESGNGTSNFARNRNNISGIYYEGKYRSFDSVNQCIEYTAKILAGKTYRKKPTIIGVQMIYCPVGAENDPGKLNKYWLGGVLDNMEKLWGKTIYLVDSRE